MAKRPTPSERLERGTQNLIGTIDGNAWNIAQLGLTGQVIGELFAESPEILAAIRARVTKKLIIECLDAHVRGESDELWGLLIRLAELHGADYELEPDDTPTHP